MVDNALRKIFADVLNIDGAEIGDDSTPGTLENWESLNHLNLVASVEDYFGISIEPEDISEMAESYGKFKEIVSGKLARRS